MGIKFWKWFLIADLSANINGPEHNVDEIIAAGENSGDYLKLAKKGGGHQG